MRKSDNGPRAWFREDPLVFILSIALLVAMGAATLYHFKYAIIDHTVMPGRVTIYKDGQTLLSLTVEDDEQLSARVVTRGRMMEGRLKLEGAETDTVLYRLVDITLPGGADPKGLVLYVRVPRSGLQGNFTGPWMVYYSFPLDEETGGSDGLQYSDWVFISPDGTARVGSADNYNAMTALRRDLEKNTGEYVWERRERDIVRIMEIPSEEF